MKALTLKPEFAEAVIYGPKRIENRSWGANVRGDIAIHRGGKNGAILGVVEVIEVLSPEEALQKFPNQRENIFGPLCWVLDNVRKVDPILCGGRLSLWTLSDEQEGKVSAWLNSEETPQKARAAGKARARKAPRAAPREALAQANREPLKPSAARAEGAAEPAGAEPIGTPASEALCREICDRSGGTILLGFSRGKDSIAAWLWLKNFARRIVPFHCAAVPHLGFVDASLDYYEQFFDTPIERCLSGEFSGALAKLWFQPANRETAIDRMSLWEYENLEVARLVAAKHGCANAWCAFGINLSDSIDRRIYVQKSGGKNERRRTFYPCLDWPKEMILRTIEESGVRLPADYRLANRSLAGVPNVRHLMRMETEFPDDFARVELWFPFIRARMARDLFRTARRAALATA